MFNQEQVKGMVERFLTITATVIATKILTWMVVIKFITNEDVGMLMPGLVIFLVALPSLAYGWWVNRGQSLASALIRAAPANSTTVVTTPDIAKNTPETAIVSNTDARVVTEGEVVTTKPAQVVVNPTENK
jgi:hypothetical protein